MKRSGKPLAKPGTPRRPGEPQTDRDAAESVAGEEDPGSALEQFSDLMHDSPAQDEAAADAQAPQPSGAGESRRSSDEEAGRAPEPDPDRRG